MKLSRLLQYLAGIVVAAVCLWIFFKGVDVKLLLAELKRSNIAVLLTGAALSLVSLWIRALRWHIILPAAPGANKKNLFSITVIGFMANNVLPARMGEAARALLLWRKNRYSAATCIGSLVLERIMDTMALASFFFIPVLITNGMGMMRDMALLLAAGFGAGVIGIAGFAAFPGPVKKGLSGLAGLLPGRVQATARKIGRELGSNLDWIFSLKNALAVIVLTYAIEYCYASILLLLVGQPHTFGVVQCMLAQAMAALGAAIPLAPGYVGTLHAMLLKGLTLVGVEENKGRAIAIIYHAITYLPVTALGLFYYFRTDVSFREIAEAKKRLDD